MNDELESARYMLARAQHHIADLGGQIKTFLASQPYAGCMEHDPETNEELYKIKLVKPMPAMLNGIASDAVCNLRSVLDQAGYAVSIAAGGPGKNTYFPFGDTAAEVHSRKSGGSKEIPDEIFAVMESFKPYRGGDDLLWTLNKLCNANKHRIVNPTAMAGGGGHIRFLQFRGAGVLEMPRWDSKNNEIVMSRGKPGGKLSYDMDITTFVAFSEVETVTSNPADAVLYAIAGIVERVLVAVEAEARRIGLFH